MNANHKKVIKYINDNNIELKEENIIYIGIQSSCEMATVELNNECLMMGNYWDFHNGCHGMEVPSFNSYNELSEMFEEALVASGKNVKVVIDKKWVYED